MHAFRLLSVSLVVVAGITAAVVSCGGGGGKSIDASVHRDGGVDAPHDASTAVTNAVGQNCTGTGTCPTIGGVAYECLASGSGSSAPAFCSKPCTGSTDTSCGTGYTGPGLPACIFQVGSAGSAQSFCGVVCADKTGSCPSTTCNNMCPTGDTCSATLMGSNGSAEGSACQ